MQNADEDVEDVYYPGSGFWEEYDYEEYSEVEESEAANQDAILVVDNKAPNFQLITTDKNGFCKVETLTIRLPEERSRPGVVLVDDDVWIIGGYKNG